VKVKLKVVNQVAAKILNLYNFIVLVLVYLTPSIEIINLLYAAVKWYDRHMLHVYVKPNCLNFLIL